MSSGVLHEALISAGVPAPGDDPLMFELMNAPADEFERLPA